MKQSPFWYWEPAFHEDYTVYGKGMKEEEGTNKMSAMTWTTKDMSPEKLDGRFLKQQFGDYAKSWTCKDFSFYVQQNRQSLMNPVFPILGSQLLFHPNYKINIPLHGLVWNANHQQFQILVLSKHFRSQDLERNPWFCQYIQLLVQTLRHSRYRSEMQKGTSLDCTKEILLFRYPELKMEVMNLSRLLSTKLSISFSIIYHRAQAIQECRENGYPVDDNHFPFAFPNMKFDAEWYTNSLREEKQRLAKNSQEWTLLPYVTTRKRKEWISKYGKSMTLEKWENHPSQMSIPDFFQYHCVKINSSSQDPYFIHPRVYDRFSSFFSSSSTFQTNKRVFVDFEWTRDCLYLVGVWILDVEIDSEIDSEIKGEERKGTYHCFWAKHLDSKSEYDLLQQVYTFLKPFRKVLYYFYAEPGAWIRFCQKYQLVEESTLFEDSMDIHKIFWEGPVVFQGCYNCKLKEIAKAMKQWGCIDIQFPKDDENYVEDGKHSMQIAEDMYRLDPSDEKRITLQESLQKYNQFDVQCLGEIWYFLKVLFEKKYTKNVSIELKKSTQKMSV